MLLWKNIGSRFKRKGACAILDTTKYVKPWIDNSRPCSKKPASWRGLFFWAGPLRPRHRARHPLILLTIDMATTTVSATIARIAASVGMVGPIGMGFEETGKGTGAIGKGSAEAAKGLEGTKDSAAGVVILVTGAMVSTIPLNSVSS